MGPHGSMRQSAMHGTDRSPHSCAVPFSESMWPQAPLLEMVHLSSFSQSWLPQQTWKETKSQSLHVIHLSVIRQKLSCFWLHGNAFPCSGMGISLFCYYLWHFKWDLLERKNTTARKEKAFITACQELTSMEHGLHTRTVPLSSYCSAGSCFWTVCTCCQRRVFLNTAMNSATDSTAMDFQLLNGKLAWYHRGSLLRARLSYGAMHIKCP